MSKKLEKMAVFAFLQEQGRALSLAELLELLDGQCAERTLRRWLADMSNAGLIEKLGQKRGTQYSIRKTKEALSSERSIFNIESQAILLEVQQALFKRRPVTYHAEWLSSYEPNKTFYLNDNIRTQLFNAGNKNNIHLAAGTYAHTIYHRLLIDLSYNSSRLEGNTYSLLDTQRLILEGRGAENKLDEEKIMILNHKEAITHLVNSAHKLKIDSDEIFTLHYLLSDALLSAHYSGKVRDYGVRIASSTYVPWENKEKLMQQLELICKKAELIDNPFEQSVFLLIQISYLQAFADVNKRTARLSANIPLIKNNLVPLSFNDISRDDYINAMLAIYEFNNINPLIDLYVYSYLRTCQFYKITTEELGFDEVRARYRQIRRELIHDIITQCLVGEDLDSYIEIKSKKAISEEDLFKFTEDLKEDLKEITPARLVGLGVSSQQLNEWLTKHLKSLC